MDNGHAPFTHLHVNMQSTVYTFETIHGGYTVHIYSNISEWNCVFVHLHACARVVFVSGCMQAGVCFVLPIAHTCP